MRFKKAKKALWQKEAYKLCLHDYCEKDDCENVKLITKTLAEERERCAKVAEEHAITLGSHYCDEDDCTKDIAQAIRNIK